MNVRISKGRHREVEALCETGAVFLAGDIKGTRSSAFCGSEFSVFGIDDFMALGFSGRRVLRV